MKVKKVMSKRLAYATPDMEIGKVAEMMADYKVGSLPVIENKDSRKVVGIVTDRDITTRVVAKGKDPQKMTAKDVMSTPVVTVKRGDKMKDVAQMMEKNQIRRIPVVDNNGEICGMVSQADLARNAGDQTVADMVQRVSKPSKKASKV